MEPMHRTQPTNRNTQRKSIPTNSRNNNKMTNKKQKKAIKKAINLFKSYSAFKDYEQND